MNDNPRRLISHAFFRRYAGVEVPCLHDDKNGIFLCMSLIFCMLAQICFSDLCSKFEAFILCIL